MTITYTRCDDIGCNIIVNIIILPIRNTHNDQVMFRFKIKCVKIKQAYTTLLRKLRLLKIRTAFQNHTYRIFWKHPHLLYRFANDLSTTTNHKYYWPAAARLIFPSSSLAEAVCASGLLGVDFFQRKLRNGDLERDLSFLRSLDVGVTGVTCAETTLQHTNAQSTKAK